MGLRNIQEWSDWDVAAYELGLTLGIFDRKTHPHMRDLKGVFWSSNLVGHALHNCLEELAKADILLARGDEHDEEDDGFQHTVFTQFKLNPAFRGYWESPHTPLKEFALEVFKDD